MNRLAVWPLLLLLVACADGQAVLDAPEVMAPEVMAVEVAGREAAGLEAMRPAEMVPEAVPPAEMAEAEMLPGAAPPEETAKVETAPGGEWVIAEVFGMEPPRSGGGGLAGRRLRLEADGADDALGHFCPSPGYVAVQAGEAEFLGAAASAPPSRTVTVIEVSCGGAPFARFATWRDGSLLTRVGGAILRLERVPAPPPAPVAAMTIADLPIPAAPPLAIPAAPPLPIPAAPPLAMTGEKLVYLASFNGNATARRGWRRLAAKSALLASLQSVTKEVDLSGKGHFIRLFAKAGDADQAARLCAELKHQLPDCGISWR